MTTIIWHEIKSLRLQLAYNMEYGRRVRLTLSFVMLWIHMPRRLSAIRCYATSYDVMNWKRYSIACGVVYIICFRIWIANSEWSTSHEMS